MNPKEISDLSKESTKVENIQPQSVPQLNRKARKSVEKYLKTKEMIKKESFSDRVERIRKNQEKGKEIHATRLREIEDQLFRKNNPQIDEE